MNSYLEQSLWIQNCMNVSIWIYFKTKDKMWSTLLVRLLEISTKLNFFFFLMLFFFSLMIKVSSTPYFIPQWHKRWFNENLNMGAKESASNTNIFCFNRRYWHRYLKAPEAKTPLLINYGPKAINIKWTISYILSDIIALKKITV